MAGILRLVNDGGGSQTQLTASGSTDRNIALPDADGVLVVEPTSSGGGTGAYLARNASASEAERTAAGEIIFSNNISVAGTSAFTGLTTHASGVNVTGGNAQNQITNGMGAGSAQLILAFDNERFFKHNKTSSNINRNYFNDGIECDFGVLVTPNSYVANGDGLSAGYVDGGAVTNHQTPSGKFSTHIGFRAYSAVTDSTLMRIEGFTADFNGSNNISSEYAYGFYAKPSVSDSSQGINAGFSSALGAGSGSNYNFYATSDAPNYFAGNLRVTSDPTKGRSDLIQPADNTTGLEISPLGIYVSKRIVSNQPTVGSFTAQVKDSNAAQTTANFTQTLARFTFIASDNSVKTGDIRGDGSGGIFLDDTSDYRTKENIVDLPSAVDAIKSLRPVNYNYTWAPGRTRPGFVAHELQETLPVAVTGEKDATEAIGTLADYDGTVLETEVTEPSELEYTEEVETNGVATMVTRTRSWTPTGTRPVYQGVDQTKLIPLLTKALQEALERIEALENA